MRLLAIDTSNQPLSVATAEDDIILAELSTNTKNTHGESLMPAISTLMDMTPFEMKKIDRIVVAKGPGSYTGLRIGATTAKTLAWTLKKELAAVSSLALIAANYTGTSDYIVPLFDARRGNIYTGLYQYKDNRLENIEPDTHIQASVFAESLKNHEGNFVLVGIDANKHIDTFIEVLGDRVKIAPAYYHLPRASVLTQMGRDIEPIEIHTFEPDYLKLTEAEENWLADHPNEGDTSYVEEV